MEVPNTEVSWNNDPEWVEYIQTLEPVIEAIAAKCTTDVHLQQDCAQEARIALMHVRPTNIDGYGPHQRGETTRSEWLTNLDRYCRQVIKFTILSTLNPINTGNWYVGRTRRRLDLHSGDRIKVHVPARFSSLDQLTEEAGLQIDEEFNLTWDNVSSDGLPPEGE